MSTFGDSVRELASQFDSGSFRRGVEYFESGRVQLRSVEETGSDEVHLYGRCRGSGRRMYDQHVMVFFDEGPRVVGHCDCPVGFNCKHVVAAVLAWRAQEERWSAGAAGEDFGTWLARGSQAEPAPAPASGEQLQYVLQPHPLDSEQLDVSLVVSRRRKDGKWGVGRRVKAQSLAMPVGGRSSWASADDQEIGRLLMACAWDLWDEPKPRGRAGATALLAMLETGRCYWGEDRQGPLQPGPVRDLELEWVAQGDWYFLRVASPELEMFPDLDPPVYVDPASEQAGVLQLPPGLDREHLANLESAPPVPADSAAAVSRRLVLQDAGLPTPVPVAVEECTLAPVPRLVLLFDSGRPESAAAGLGFRYDDAVLEPGDESTVPVLEEEDRVLRIARDAEEEAAARATLEASGLLQSVEGRPGHFRLAGDDPADGLLSSAAVRRWFEFQEQVLPGLRERGWEIVEGTEELPTLEHADRIGAEVEPSGMDWFDLRFDLEVDGRSVPLLPLLTDLLEEYTPDDELPETLYLDTGGGHYVAVPGDRLRPVLQTVFELFDREVDDAGERLALSRLDAPRLLEMGDTPVRGGGVEALYRLAQRLKDFEGIRSVDLPSGFHGELRGYQQQGLNWMQFLREYDLSGVLADDMGLGKTVQTLAHLTAEKEAGRMDRPSLIIAPTSLMSNWQREAEQFAPQLKVLVLQGPQRKQYFERLTEFDLVLSTYPLLARDHPVVEAQPWHCLILDEAQQIKNPRARASQVVRSLEARHRLCLTGTPMENHLGELWAQFDFLLPGFLGDQKRFRQQYRKPIEEEGDQERMGRLGRRVAPFMLRRTKDRVAEELPPRTELLRTTRMGSRQGTLYESIRLTMEKKVRDAVARKGLARSHITILDALLKLRQVCCDPRLVQSGGHDTRGIPSAKLELLLEILPELLDEGRRILLFSQFTRMLGLIQHALEERGIAYSKLTGQTRKRDEAIERFRSGQASVFLVSLKAGGVGLNLTEADTVIHYDPWWNPAVEAQATDRAHRIGQDKPVFVYKLVTEGTVEEKILSLQERKQHLADHVYGRKGQDDDQPPLDAETLQELLTGD
ncbi:DEAD/DEAH box helicase [Thioalkalivibrio sp. ALE11]|uniref:DEAD/DEAH box helicase n=1 Tax=Thioalkalivibrio sp. ALE11 TaxID=1265494 RepID=UPI0003A8E2F5|nr:DEAD/DEAH box helicase [Thioalkalivibrio sp. ALE11]